MMKEPVIIAISGHKGAGKNTIADYMRGYFCVTIDVQEYAFADLLKGFCINVLGLDESQCYGSDDEKNTLTKYCWEDTQRFSCLLAKPRLGFMTGRDVMQVFGTESVRAWFGNVWAEATIRRIYEECPTIAIVSDNRFVNEVEAILEQPQGYVIRLTRSPFAGDKHASETSLDNYNWDRERCFVLDNADLSIDEQNNKVYPILGQILSECNL